MQTLSYDTRHGSPYDRGSADAFYGRVFDPHYFTGATYSSQRISVTDPNCEAYKAYAAGYYEQTDRKIW